MTNTLKQTQRKLNQNSAWIRPFARFGYFAKGTVFLVIGFLALQVALGMRSQASGSKGAFVNILIQPFGRILLAVVAIGLLGYMIWLFILAIMDPENEGTNVTGLITRIGNGINGLLQASLAMTALQLVIGFGGGANNSPEDWTAMALAQPFGRWLIALVGLGIVGTGFYQLFEAYRASFRHTLKLDKLSKTGATWVLLAGRLGRFALAVVLQVAGIFLIRAALQFDPDEAQGLGDTLQSLEQQLFGPWILGGVAIGLIAHGIYMFVEAKYRIIEFT